jgi:hypothetical protein
MMCLPLLMEMRRPMSERLLYRQLAVSTPGCRPAALSAALPSTGENAMVNRTSVQCHTNPLLSEAICIVHVLCQHRREAEGL